MKDYEWSKEQASRLKAVWDGKGDAYMQRDMIQHLVEIICGINQIGFDPENSNITAFNAGRRWVARQIQNAVTLPLDKLVKEEVHDTRLSRLPTATELRASADAGQPRTRGARARAGSKHPA